MSLEKQPKQTVDDRANQVIRSLKDVSYGEPLTDQEVECLARTLNRLEKSELPGRAVLTTEVASE